MSRVDQMRAMVSQLPPEKQPLLFPKGDQFFVGTMADGLPSIAIVLPPPHAALNAHNKGHWSKKTKLVKTLRWLACQTAKKAMDAFKLKPIETAAIEYRFYFPDDIHRDSANAVQSQKPAIDGLVDAKLIARDNWQSLFLSGVYCGIDAANPRTVVLVHAINSIPTLG